MVKGVIYRYVSPSGKSYIGQTTNEARRKKLWNSSSYHYAGTKIDRARKKYGNTSFDYKILFCKEFVSKEIAQIWLNICEKYYIQLYDTMKNGYNCEKGGGGNCNHRGAINHHHGGYKLSEETKKKIGEGSRKWHNSEAGKAKMSSARRGKNKKKGYRIKANFKSVVQLSLKGEFIMEYPSIYDAEISLKDKAHINRVNIGKVCKGFRGSAGGYRWLYSKDYYEYLKNPTSKNLSKSVVEMLNNIRIYNKYKLNNISCCKKIIQMDLDGNDIRQFDSVKEASVFLGKCRTNISQCLTGKRKSAYGYKWKYLNCA